MTTRIPPQPSTTVGRPAKPLAVRRLAIAAALLAFLPALAGCMSGAPGPLASLPTAAESSRAFRAMGYSNVSCRQTSPKQMKCYSRQTGAVYSIGHVDSGSSVGIYNFPQDQWVRAYRSRDRFGQPRIEWGRRAGGGQYKRGTFAT